MKRSSLRLWLVLGASGLVLASGLLLLIGSSGCASAVNRVAFYPDRTFALRDADLPPGTERVTIPTSDGEKLEGFFMRREGAERIAIYFHGNGGNIAQRLPELAHIASLEINVLGVGYRGYGASTGHPSEAGIYRDGRAALDYAEHTLHFAPNQIVLFGRSIGSTVAVDIASSPAGRELAGVVLVTPLTSARDVAKAHAAGSVAFLVDGAFNNEAKAPRIVAPVLVIHGSADEVIPFQEGRKIYDIITAPKRFVAIDGGRHNDLELRDPEKYWGALNAFFASLKSPAS